MKRVVAAFVAAFITVSFAFAQETETPTSAAPPGASPEGSPESSPTKKYPVPGRAGPSASPSAGASPVAKAMKSPTPAPVIKGDPGEQIRQIEQAIENAAQAHSSRSIDPYIASDAVITDVRNRVLNKSEAMSDLWKNTDTFTSTKVTDVKILMVEKNIAVATGKALQSGKDRAGKSFNRTYRFTDTFVNRNGRWTLIASHASLVGGR